MDFRISALEAGEFSHLFGMDTGELEKLGVKRMEVDTHPGFPCRVSLQDAAIGETVLLLNYEHQPAASPYRSRHAIFVRESAQTAQPKVNEFPESLRIRLLSLRAFGEDGLMVDADVVHGREAEPAIRKMLENKSISYLHIHNAKPGCYAARVERA
jgi:hypothetical protein